MFLPVSIYVYVCARIDFDDYNAYIYITARNELKTEFIVWNNYEVPNHMSEIWLMFTCATGLKRHDALVALRLKRHNALAHSTLWSPNLSFCLK